METTEGHETVGSTGNAGSEPGEVAVAAGAFSTWLAEIAGAIDDGHAMDVPCDGCTACCRSSQFVHIGPDETDTLDHVPAELLFPAPGRPVGHVLLGYDERGHCPMLVDDRCSIYAHRPVTCRTYDCRIFAATGLEPDLHQPLIADRARRWRFDHPTDHDRAGHVALRSTAADGRRHRPDGTDPPGRSVPASATGRAVAAIEIHLRRTTAREPSPE